MYYLLKDNRIIDTSNQTFKEEYTSVNGITHYSIETPNETHIHYTFGGGKYINNIYTFNSTEIKKQSENVFDLIEVGDLIKFYKYIGGARTEKTITSQVCNNFEGSTFTYGGSTFHCDILAIYKPNEKGDYIKVWEIKNE